MAVLRRPIKVAFAEAMPHPRSSRLAIRTLQGAQEPGSCPVLPDQGGRPCDFQRFPSPGQQLDILGPLLDLLQVHKPSEGLSA
jgi:hypothetical protein